MTHAEMEAARKAARKWVQLHKQSGDAVVCCTGRRRLDVHSVLAWIADPFSVGIEWLGNGFGWTRC